MSGGYQQDEASVLLDEDAAPRRLFLVEILRERIDAEPSPDGGRYDLAQSIGILDDPIGVERPRHVVGADSVEYQWLQAVVRTRKRAGLPTPPFVESDDRRRRRSSLPI
jgi:hypothetical protein